MAEITFTVASGATKTVKGMIGLSVMEVALQNGIEGIDAECMGSCACATCHVVIDNGWVERVGPPNENEADLLEILDNRQLNSRLSCQIKFLPALDGLVVDVPKKP